jgi:hypothetical protein
LNQLNILIVLCFQNGSKIATLWHFKMLHLGLIWQNIKMQISQRRHGY